MSEYENARRWFKRGAQSFAQFITYNEKEINELFEGLWSKEKEEINRISNGLLKQSKEVIKKLLEV
nr:MAG: hypothetical protein [uncultured archaeon]